MNKLKGRMQAFFAQGYVSDYSNFSNELERFHNTFNFTYSMLEPALKEFLKEAYVAGSKAQNTSSFESFYLNTMQGLDKNELLGTTALQGTTLL